MALLSRFLSGWRHKIITPYLNGDVLDIGCGNAVILQEYSDQIDRYAGIERHPGHAEHLSRKFPGAVFLAKDLDHDPLEFDADFDTVLMVAIVEHIWNQKRLFEQAILALKPGGKIVITTPTPFGNDLVHPIGAKFGLFAQSAVDDHIVIYNKRRFINLAREFGLNLLVYRRFQLFSNQLAVLEKGNRTADQP